MKKKWHIGHQASGAASPSKGTVETDFERLFHSDETGQGNAIGCRGWTSLLECGKDLESTFQTEFTPRLGMLIGPQCGVWCL